MVDLGRNSLCTVGLRPGSFMARSKELTIPPTDFAGPLFLLSQYGSTAAGAAKILHTASA